MTIPQHHPQRLDVTPGFEAECTDQTCEDRIECNGCGATVCPMHSPPLSLSECVGGGWHHQDDCEDTCLECSLAARDDYYADRADAMRKGEL